MTHVEYLTWLREFLANAPGKHPSLRIIGESLKEVEPFVPTGHSFCGGTWDASKFDYYWVPEARRVPEVPRP